MKKFYFLLLLISPLITAQVLHHQMISSQGATINLQNGMTITQTIGQINSSIGKFNNSFKGIQGFQQSLISIKSEPITQIPTYKIIAYPNPFNTNLNIAIPNLKLGEIIVVSIVDLMGRIVYRAEKSIGIEDLILDLTYLPSANYILNINHNNKNFNTKITKK